MLRDLASLGVQQVRGAVPPSPAATQADLLCLMYVGQHDGGKKRKETRPDENFVTEVYEWM